MNENYGNLEELKKMGENRKMNFTKEQLKDKELKNVDGESNIEVAKRMEEVLTKIIDSNYKKIAVVSHGASIKFWLSQYCEIDGNVDLIYNNNKLDIKSPSVLAITVKNKIITNISQIF